MVNKFLNNQTWQVIKLHLISYGNPVTCMSPPCHFHISISSSQNICVTEQVIKSVCQIKPCHPRNDVILYFCNWEFLFPNQHFPKFRVGGFSSPLILFIFATPKRNFTPSNYFLRPILNYARNKKMNIKNLYKIQIV